MRSRPFEIVRVHTEQWFAILCALQVFLDQLWGYTDYVLAFPVFHHVQRLECANDVLLSKACHRTACGTMDKQIKRSS